MPGTKHSNPDKPQAPGNNSNTAPPAAAAPPAHDVRAKLSFADHLIGLLKGNGPTEPVHAGEGINETVDKMSGAPGAMSKAVDAVKADPKPGLDY